MKRRNDIYNVGNDYDQKVSAYFITDDTEAEKQKGAFPGYKAYSDGLYHFTTKPVYELSGGESALNKRVFNKLPQSGAFPGYKAYSDGLYHFTTKPVYELSGGESALNKRVFNKLPQSNWGKNIETWPASAADTLSAISDASAVFSKDYATVEDPTDNVWEKPNP